MVWPLVSLFRLGPLGVDSKSLSNLACKGGKYLGTKKLDQVYLLIATTPVQQCVMQQEQWNLPSLYQEVAPLVVESNLKFLRGCLLWKEFEVTGCETGDVSIMLGDTGGER